MPSPNDRKQDLLCAYAGRVLSVREDDDLDATTRKMLRRLDEIDGLSSALQEERNHITAALLSVADQHPLDHRPVYTREEADYALRKPFRYMSLTDACLRALKDHSGEWLDKHQVENLVAVGGYEFKAEHATNSVHVTLRRLAQEGYCESYSGKGSRTTKLRFLKDREPAVLSTITTNLAGGNKPSPTAFSRR